MEGRRTGFRQHRQLFGHTRRLQSRPVCQQPSQQPLLLLLTLLVAVLPVVLFNGGGGRQNGVSATRWCLTLSETLPFSFFSRFAREAATCPLGAEAMCDKFLAMRLSVPLPPPLSLLSLRHARGLEARRNGHSVLAPRTSKCTISRHPPAAGKRTSAIAVVCSGRCLSANCASQTGHETRSRE